MRYKNFIFGLLLISLALPIVQMHWRFASERELFGAYTKTNPPVFSANAWWSGAYQDQASKFFEENFGFRTSLIRLRNQLHYWLYHESTTYVVPGINQQLYSWDYWSSYRGFNHLGEDSLRKSISQLAILSDSLEQMNKTFLCVIAPNKVRYMPENMPLNYEREPGDENNYKTSVELLHEYNIPVLDLNARFLELKDTVKYPLFANTSTHWSGYAMHLGLGWMIDSLERRSGMNLVNLDYNNWKLRDTAISSDHDMLDLMNLFWDLPIDSLAFPNYKLDTANRAKPAKVLLIGDSFFWNFYAFEVRHQIFDKSSRFWYYNNTERDLHGNERPVSELSAHEAVRNADFIVILATEANMHVFPYGFPEKFLRESEDKRMP